MDKHEYLQLLSDASVNDTSKFCAVSIERPKSKRLAHLYGLPKTHKEKLAMCPILSATGTYNYALAKWLDAKLKPLSVNENTITDIFAFTNEICGVKINPGEILVSYNVSSLFTNVPLDETIDILAHKAFENNWFNDTYGLNLSKTDLVDLLHVANECERLRGVFL